jgi:5-methylcytosine-specific restriction protein A
MENALYLNGVYESVLDEIIKSQEKNPDNIFYLQPYSEKIIKQLKKETPTTDSPLSAYISTSGQLNQICYSAEIVGWEDKREIAPSRRALLNEHIKKFQPKEGKIYPEARGKKCVNLISIKNLKKLSNQLSTSNLIKINNGEPLKPRTQPGNWSYVKALPLLLIEKSFVQERLEEEFLGAISDSLKDDIDKIAKRLAEAQKKPEKLLLVSSGFRRNPDVVAFLLLRANGKCELCGLDAPFFKAKDDAPYLEVHHWITLSDDGEDTVENAVALCPNCHKEAHFGQNRDYIKSNKALPADAKKLRG